MCGIAGVLDIGLEYVPGLESRLEAMQRLLRHRGPDGDGVWMHDHGQVGFTHRRLTIIDLSATGAQPMTDGAGNWITYNGETYNYLEFARSSAPSASSAIPIRKSSCGRGGDGGPTASTGCAGCSRSRCGTRPLRRLFCARDRFGIKPFYYTVVGTTLYFASETKALLPFVEAIETDLESFSEYLTFQFCLGGKTLFKGISELLPAHTLSVVNGRVKTTRYWEVDYKLDFDHTARYFKERLHDLLADSVRMHLRADVPVGAYISGGLDSSTVAAMARPHAQGAFLGFNGKFTMGPDYDESRYARALADAAGIDLHEIGYHVRRFRQEFPASHISPGLPGGRSRLVSAVHGVAARCAPSKGRARRAGWRRGVRADIRVT